MPDLIEQAELDAEFAAMRTIDTALRELARETGARERVLQWACQKHGVTPLGGQRDA